jgi:dodecin
LVPDKIPLKLFDFSTSAHEDAFPDQREIRMANSVYKIVEIIGTSSESWDDAAKTAVEKAGESLRDLRVAEVIANDLVVENGKVQAFRTKLKLSFKLEGSGSL